MSTNEERKAALGEALAKLSNPPLVVAKTYGDIGEDYGRGLARGFLSVLGDWLQDRRIVLKPEMDWDSERKDMAPTGTYLVEFEDR